MVLEWTSDTTDHFPSVSWSSSSITADILTCWSEYPLGEMSSLCFKIVPRLSLSRCPNTDYCLTLHYRRFLPSPDTAWKPFSLHQLSSACLLQWSNEDSINTSCRSAYYLCLCRMANGGSSSPVLLLPLPMLLAQVLRTYFLWGIKFFLLLRDHFPSLMIKRQGTQGSGNRYMLWPNSFRAH